MHFKCCQVVGWQIKLKSTLKLGGCKVALTKHIYSDTFNSTISHESTIY